MSRVTITLYRKDLRKGFEDIPIEKVELEHCRLSTDDGYAASNIVFMEGSICKIMKAKDAEITIPVL